jgi:hypothetical protein
MPAMLAIPFLTNMDYMKPWPSQRKLCVATLGIKYISHVLCFLILVIDGIAIHYCLHISDTFSAWVKHRLQCFISLVVYSMCVRRVLNTSTIRPENSAKFRHIGILNVYNFLLAVTYIISMKYCAQMSYRYFVSA